MAKFTLGIALARLGPILVLQDLSAMSMGSVIVLPRAEIAKDAVLLFVVAVFYGVGTVIIAVSSQMLVFNV